MRRKKEIRCPICGVYDNADGRRSGLCLDCYCKLVEELMFDQEGRGGPTLDEVSKIIGTKHGGCELQKV